jgi:hypothetical protein
MVRGPNGGQMQVASTGCTKCSCAIALFAQKAKAAIRKPIHYTALSFAVLPTLHRRGNSAKKHVLRHTGPC